MENSNLNGKILGQLKSLISHSCNLQHQPHEFQHLHREIIKNHYNAVDVSVDYHRRRVTMYVVMGDERYNPRKVNVSLDTLWTNLRFTRLDDFLNSCLQEDSQSMAFYLRLLKSFGIRTRNERLSMTIA